MHALVMSIFTRRLSNNKLSCARSLFEGVLNKVFNAVDEDRRAKLGPNRVCAEWLLRNGASVKFKGHSEYLVDYNALPEEDFPLIIVEVEAIEASISHYGFNNFRGCEDIWKIVFHKCNFLENEALKELIILKDSLKYLRVSNCPDLTDSGLLYLQGLKLTDLELSSLPYVKNKDSLLTALRMRLPNCKIVFE